MFRDIQAVTRAGLHANEDAVGAGKDFLFVVDGATGLSHRNYMDPRSDARWFAGQTARLLQELLPDRNLSLSDILHTAMDTVLRRWDGPAEALPTAAIAVWRCRGDELELLRLGDCGASAEKADGSVLCWQERELTRLDALVLEQMLTRCRDTGCTMEEARRWATPILQKHRALHNTPEGYWTLDPTGVGIDHAQTARLPLRECRSVCAYSDGFAQLIHFMPGWDAAALHRMLLEQGAQKLMDNLFEKQEQDRDMLLVPRFKLRDDTTAAAARIGWEEKHELLGQQDPAGPPSVCTHSQ